MFCSILVCCYEFFSMYGGIFDLLPFLGFYIVLLLASSWARLSEVCFALKVIFGKTLETSLLYTASFDKEIRCYELFLRRYVNAV